mmetsp:Transcript_37423/g.122405  ORF Transcript_37423/g.122405 Transcript_37423/m.122405 type:complete len:214 (+) Transcript_37423:408-1049(+)
MEHFAAARSCLDEAFEHVCDYISVKVVFGDLRASLLLGLYAPSPHAARISAPLRTLDGTLGALHRMLPTEWTRRRVLFHVFRATCAAFEAVLLDPCSVRDYAVDDVTVFSHDLRLMQDFFVAENEVGEPQGVTHVEAEECLASLKLLLGILDTRSEVLVELIARPASISTTLVGHQNFRQHELYVLLAGKVLSKRTDSAARSWKAAPVRGAVS